MSDDLTPPHWGTPVDSERAYWPDTTRDYVEGIEAELTRLRAQVDTIRAETYERARKQAAKVADLIEEQANQRGLHEKASGASYAAAAIRKMKDQTDGR